MALQTRIAITTPLTREQLRGLFDRALTTVTELDSRKRRPQTRMGPSRDWRPTEWEHEMLPNQGLPAHVRVVCGTDGPIRDRKWPLLPEGATVEVVITTHMLGAETHARLLEDLLPWLEEIGATAVWRGCGRIESGGTWKSGVETVRPVFDAL